MKQVSTLFQERERELLVSITHNNKLVTTKCVIAVPPAQREGDLCRGGVVEKKTLKLYHNIETIQERNRVRIRKQFCTDRHALDQ